ncbi:MAG: alpha/beta hydrolase [Desulfovermiculus sp.]
MLTIGKILLVLFGGYLLILLLSVVFQDRMVFFPDPNLTASPADIGLAYEDVWLTNADGYTLHGWYVPGPKADTRCTALFLHGNAGNISHRLDMLKVIYDLGLNCLILDYQGYGQSQGTPSEQGLYMDAQTAWTWLVGTKDVHDEEIVCWGRSLGGPVAARLARDNGPGALIIESTFTSLPELGQEHYPFLPVKLISRLSFPTLSYIQEVTCPVLVVHSSEDELVPYAFGQKLYKTAREPKELLTIQGDHISGFLVSKKRYVRGIQKFLKNHNLVH